MRSRERAAAALRAVRRERGPSAGARRGSLAEYPRVPCTRWWGTSSATWGACLAGAGGWWPSSGGTIGNFKPEQRAHFFREVRGGAGAGRRAAAGHGPRQGRDRLFAAYNDRAGVTAEFNRNVLRVLNRELGGGLPTRSLRARGPCDEEPSRSRCGSAAGAARGAHPPRLRSPRLRRRRGAAHGDELEVPGPGRVVAELAAHGLEGVAGSWRDPAGDFALIVARVRS